MGAAVLFRLQPHPGTANVGAVAAAVCGRGRRSFAPPAVVVPPAG
ncbi:hypothetical protein C731_0074 [Mycolicibacterium hassiacum DSM 44199]|uniref:Uncharacterized protein n=1 Tax=Mycolicibacterium hassiacum (strain DSM 44199 / CIP 105218 / JCM 12690 / 3849) TaxID=1122247 RepID=K5BDJ0_MYCHD|nr:hypothetical protein C731_0074 [Mycolicibacterium hassiacum DSM 44199]